VAGCAAGIDLTSEPCRKTRCWPQSKSWPVTPKWESAEALRVHATSPHMAAYAAKTRYLIESRTIHVLQPG
jgi:quinol monooxygenase YgiN